MLGVMPLATTPSPLYIMGKRRGEERLLVHDILWSDASTGLVMRV